MKILYPNGKTKALTFSYDDNQIHDRRLIEMLNHYGLCATFHLNSGMIGKKDAYNEFITWDELSVLYRGHEVACHGYHHPFFRQLPLGELQYEILEDKRCLEKAVKYVVRGMSYPFGDYSEETIRIARALGIEYSRTVAATNNLWWPEDFMRWHPTCHHNAAFHDNGLIEGFVNCSGYPNLPLLYIWGHSFEFEREQTWSEMDQLCSRLSGKDEVWYATNIQIKDYICAVRALVFSADQQIVYNPSAVDVFFEYEGSQKVIHAGETFLF